MKNNFSEVGTYNDPMTGMLVFLDQGHHLIFYCLLLIIFIVSTYVFMRKTQDIGKSMLFSLHIIVFLAILFFYWGLSVSVVFIPQVVLLSLIFIEILSIGALYYNRNKGI